jgi:chemotaxis protein MotB
VLQEKLGNQVYVTTDPRGLVIEFRSNLLFDIGDDTLLGPGENLIKSISPGLSAAASAGYTVAIEGHTDNVPISSDRFRSNWELSTARATTVLRRLAAHGFPQERLMASGFADIKPKVPNDTPERRASNRRVVIKVLR